jgi:hypothetical protein
MRATSWAINLVLATAVAGRAAASPLPEGALSLDDWAESVANSCESVASPSIVDVQFEPASSCDAACDACCGDECLAGCSDGVCFPLGAALASDATWSVSTGAIFLHRSRPDPSPIITPPTPNPGSVVSASDFGFGWDAGPDVSILRRSASGLILEGRYFNDREAFAAYNIPSITTFRTAGIGVTILGGGSINSTYSTKLDSSEFNVHAPVNARCTLLAGFRWIELHDTLRSNLATPATFVLWDDNNHLYGGQFGTNILFTDPANPLRLNVALKGGIYGNDADNQFRSTIVSSTSDSDTATSFVGEVNFTGSYRIARHVALRGGYQVLWLENVALAGDAASSTTQIVGGASSPTNTNGRVWYNGATTGVEFLW